MREERRSHASLARLAACQHGVVSSAQLSELGFSSSSVGRLAAAGLLHRVHRGVYAVGHARLDLKGRCWAAILAGPRDAVLSHRAAGWVWGLQTKLGPVVEVSARHGRSRPGIIVHQPRSLPAWMRTRSDRLAVTTVARTLLDIAGSTSRRSVEACLDRAERMEILDLGAIEAVLAHQRRSRAAATLRAATEIYRAPVFSRARSERLLLALVRRAGLPLPTLNAIVAGHEIDAYWERERFAVEVDGWGPHRTRAAFERDPLKQEDLLLHGIASIRVTARRIEREPRSVAERLRAHLSRRGTRPGQPT